MRDRYVLVLAANIHEGNVYAKRAGLPRFSYRSVGAAKSVRNIQSADVHILPGFHSRRDKHSILAELRHGRDIKKLDVEMPEAPEVDVIPDTTEWDQKISENEALLAQFADDEELCAVLENRIAQLELERDDALNQPELPSAEIVAGPSIETLERVQAGLPDVVSPRPEIPKPKADPTLSATRIVGAPESI